MGGWHRWIVALYTLIAVLIFDLHYLIFDLRRTYNLLDNHFVVYFEVINMFTNNYIRR